MTTTSNQPTKQEIVAVTTTATDVPPFSELNLSDMQQPNDNTDDNNMNDDDNDLLSARLFREALEAVQEEPELEFLLKKTVLAPHVETFEDAVACTVAHRLLLGGGETSSSQTPTFSLQVLQSIFKSAMKSSTTELGHCMKNAVRQDVLAVYNRDPACLTILEIVLFFKGFAALVTHRAARRRYYQKTKPSMVALFLQSQASAVFGVDIHPAATIGAGVLLDHGTGVVIGETAVVGDGCTLLHGVTLGGTGKHKGGNRHPKIGAHVLMGAGASILGNVVVGDNAKIGAGSIVLRSIPAGATAVGAPARIIGRVKEQDPASSVDEVLECVDLYHKQKQQMPRIDSSLTATTVASDSSSSDGGGDDTNCMCPFRDLKRLGKSAPPNTVTFCTLYKLLEPHEVGSFEIGEIFFAMDNDMVGYVSLEEFEKSFVELATKYTSLDSNKPKAIASNYVTKARAADKKK